MKVLFISLLIQLTPESAAGWDRVGVVGIMVAGIFGMAYLYRQKIKECDMERERANSFEDKYIQVLLSDIEERKRDRANLDLLNQVVRRKDAE